MRYDLTDLAIFIDAVDAGSLTRAAKYNHVVLGAASARMRLLEERLGVTLLDRSRRGVTPTLAGEALLRHARVILADARRLDADLGEFAGGLRGRVRLLSNTNSLMEFLPRALGRFLARYPDISVTVEERLSHAIVFAIMEGEAEIGIIAGTAVVAGLETFPFAQDRLVLVVPHDSPLGGKPAAFLDLLDHPFVGLDETSAIQKFLDEIAEKGGRRLKLRMRLRGFDAVCLMVEAGAGLAIVPESAAIRCARTMAIRIVQITDPWSPRDLRLCVRDKKYLPALARLLLDELVQQTGTVGTR